MNDMTRYIDETDVYKLVEPRGVAKVHCSQIDELTRVDVVPKSEVEAIVEKLMSATDKVICEAKAEVAREIFEEIEKCLKHDYISSIGVYNGGLELRVAELKKKYTKDVEVVRDLAEYAVDQDIQNYKENK